MAKDGKSDLERALQSKSEPAVDRANETHISSTWPWKPELVVPAPEMAGQPEDAISFGLARDIEDLALLTRMIAVIVPMQETPIVTWRCEGESVCAMEMMHAEVRQQLQFNKRDDGMELEFGALTIEENHRRRGYSKRLARNLTLVMEQLGIRYLKTFASDDGAITWAKLGAYPQNPSEERGRLIERILSGNRAWGIPVKYRESMRALVEEAPNELIMRRVVAAVGDRDDPIGEKLLRQCSWLAYWDLQNPEIQTYLRGILT